MMGVRSGVPLVSQRSLRQRREHLRLTFERGDVMVGDSDGFPVVVCVVADAGNFASPKSSTFTVPSGRNLMLAGFKSR
jgi:hypothetical protein